MLAGIMIPMFIFLKIPRLVNSRAGIGTIENESGMSVVAESKDILKKKKKPILSKESRSNLMEQLMA